MAVPDNKKTRLPVLFGLLFLSFAGLMFEISLLRLLAITLWHHYAFLIVSCAMLGYGAAGSWQLIFRKQVPPFYPAALFSCTLVPLFAVSQWLSFDPALLPLDSFEWVNLILLFIIFSLPFFFIGNTINLLLSSFPGDSFRLYAFDLMGAAFGCAGFFVISPYFSEGQWLIIISIIGTFSLILLSQQRAHRLFSFACIVILLGIWLTGSLPIFEMNSYKTLPQALKYPGSKRIDTKWNAVSRVDWFESPLARFAPGLSLNYMAKLPPQIGITIDGDMLTAYSSWTDSKQDFLHYLPGSIIYEFLPAPSHILLLKILGGQDVQLAINKQVPNIQVQTDSALLKEWLDQKDLPPNVRIKSEKARAALARSERKYDRIIVSLEGALPSGSSGMSVLQESSLETIEGFKQLLLHLNESGWLSIHRYLLPPPRAEFRLAVTLVNALQELGWKADVHIGAFRTVSTIMFLVSAREWTEVEKSTFRRFCADKGYALIYYPGMHINEANKENRFNRPLYASAFQKILYNQKRFITDYLFDLRPVSDNNPFFYNFIRIGRLQETYRLMGKKWEALVEAGLLIPGMFIIVLLVAVLLIGSPLFLLKNRKQLLSPGMTYFFWIGLAFMGVEIVLFEKLTHFLGEPTYSLATVLGCLLVTTGVGSGLSNRLHARAYDIGHLALVVILFGYGFILDPILGIFTGSSFAIRVFIALLLTGAIGLLMGIPFPKGIVALSNINHNNESNSSSPTLTSDRVALAWAFNGLGSVIGSTGAMLLAQFYGLTALFYWASLLYVVAFLNYHRISTN